MNIQDFIDLMEANTASRHVASAPWFYYVRDITVIENNDKYGVYFVNYHDLNFPAKKFLIGVVKSNATIIKLETARLSPQKVWMDSLGFGLSELRYQAMTLWTYVHNTFEVFFNDRNPTEVEVTLNAMFEKMYQFIRHELELYDDEPPEHSFQEYFARNSTFRKRGLDLKLENGEKLDVERLRVYNWEKKVIETSFTISKKDTNASVHFKDSLITIGKTINVQAPSSNGRAISHNQLYSLSPEFKEYIDQAFALKD